MVKAVQLGGAQGKCLEPYVVLEVTNGAWPPHGPGGRAEPEEADEDRLGGAVRLGGLLHHVGPHPAVQPSQAWQTAIQCTLIKLGIF